MAGIHKMQVCQSPIVQTLNDVAEGPFRSLVIHAHEAAHGCKSNRNTLRANLVGYRPYVLTAVVTEFVLLECVSCGTPTKFTAHCEHQGKYHSLRAWLTIRRALPFIKRSMIDR